MAKRRKLKKKFYYIIVILVLLIVALIFGIKKYREYQYHQTYEYKLLEHGYQLEEVKILEQTFDNKKLDELLLIEKNSTIIRLINEKYFIKNNFDLYLEYVAKNNITDTTKVITMVNAKANNEFYSLNLKTNMNKDYEIITNKFYQLEADYEPNDLVTVSTTYAWGDYGTVKIREKVYNAFLDMWESANAAGYYLMIKSGYRSYDNQEKVYNSYEEKYGPEYADSIAARPGYSEHQTGLSLDIYSKQNTNQKTFKDSETAKWLFANAHLYGFILRYPEGKEDITGYNYEAWHYRYVGIDTATKIYEKNITFEEYYAYYLDY